MSTEQLHQEAAKRSREVTDLLALMLGRENEGRRDTYTFLLERRKRNVDPESVKLAEELFAELMPKTYSLKRARKK